jgi:hypothetical protein
VLSLNEIRLPRNLHPRSLTFHLLGFTGEREKLSDSNPNQHRDEDRFRTRECQEVFSIRVALALALVFWVPFPRASSILYSLFLRRKKKSIINTTSNNIINKI